MKTNKYDFSLSNEEVAYLTAALELFISNDTDDVPKDKKKADNIIAFTALRKFNNMEIVRSSEEYRVILASLYYFQEVITSSSSLITTIEFKQESDMKLNEVNKLITKIKNLLKVNGVNL